MGFTHCVCGSLFTLFSNKNVTKVLTLQHLIQNRDLKKHVAHLQAGRHSPDYPPGPRVCRSSKCQCSKNMQYHLACLPCAALNVMKWRHFRIKTTRRGGEWKCIHPPASLLTGIAGPRPADGQAKPGIHSGGGGAAFQWQPRRKVETSGRNVDLAPGVCRALMYTII